MSKVLVTDAQQRKALSVTRSLGKEGIDIVCCDVTGCNPVRFSKYCNKFYKCPQNGKLIDFYKYIIRTEACDVIIPTDEDSMEAVVNMAAVDDSFLHPNGTCGFLVPPVESFYTALYKNTAVKLAEDCKVNCPKTIWPKGPGDLDSVTDELDFPVVIKPVRSSGGRGVKIVFDKSNFQDEYIRIHGKYPFPLVQQYVSFKEKYDVCLIFNKQRELRGWFVQKEYRNYPIETGPGTMHESVNRTDLVDIALKIMENIPWTGVVELEFIIDLKNDLPVFMEINPRFWASLETAVLSGVNFPKMYYDIVKHGDCNMVCSYTEGVKTRWVWPGEILYLLSSHTGQNKNYPGTKVKKAIDDIFNLDDPLPLVGVILQCGYYLINKKRRDYIIKRN